MQRRRIFGNLNLPNFQGLPWGGGRLAERDMPQAGAVGSAGRAGGSDRPRHPNLLPQHVDDLYGDGASGGRGGPARSPASVRARPSDRHMFENLPPWAASISTQSTTAHHSGIWVKLGSRSLVLPDAPPFSETGARTVPEFSACPRPTGDTSKLPTPEIAPCVGNGAGRFAHRRSHSPGFWRWRDVRRKDSLPSVRPSRGR
jgi:hypothetical protein